MKRISSVLTSLTSPGAPGALLEKKKNKKQKLPSNCCFFSRNNSSPHAKYGGLGQSLRVTCADLSAPVLWVEREPVVGGEGW